MSADDMRVLTGFCLLIAYAAAAGTEAAFTDSLKITLPKSKSERLLSEATEEAPVKNGEQQDAKQQQDVKEEIHQRSAPRQSLLVEDYEEVKYGNEEKQVPQSYQFGFEVQDHKEGHQFRHEQKDAAGNVQGRFGYRDSKGQYRQVEYVADDFGFRANVKTNEAGVANEDPADVGIQKSQDLALHAQVVASGARYPTGDLTVHKDDTNNKVNLQPPQTLINDEPHSEETRYGLKHSPHPQHYLSLEANPSSNQPNEEYYYSKNNKQLRPKNASPAIVYRHFFKKHAPRRENIIPIQKYSVDFSDTTSNHRPYRSQSENFSPSSNQHQKNNEGYQHENEDYHYENEKHPQMVYHQYEQDDHPGKEIDEISSNFDETDGGTEIKHEAPLLIEPEFYEIYKNSANDADLPYSNEKGKLILIPADKVKYNTDFPQQENKQGIPFPGQTAIFIKHKNEEEPNYGERQYGFYKNSDFFNGNKQSNFLSYNNNNNKSPTPNQIRYGARYISQDLPPTQILQKAVHQPGTQIHYINKEDPQSKPSYKPDSNKGTEIHIGAKSHDTKPYNENIESYPKNLPLSVLQQTNAEAPSQNQEQFTMQQAILEIDADVYKQLIESKAPGQRIIAIPYDSQSHNYGNRASSIPVVLDKNSFPLKPQGILHLPIKHAKVEHSHQQQNNMVPLEKLKRPAAIVLHIAHGQNINFMSPKVPYKEDISHGNDHVSYKLSQPHTDTFQKLEKEIAKTRDYSKSKWIPITPLWNQIRRQSKQDGTSSASSAPNVQYISNLPRADSSIHKFSAKKSQNYNTPGGQRVY